MPEFQFHVESAEANERWAALDEFTKGYITAAMFTEAPDGGLHGTFDDVDADTVKAMAEDCADFQKANAADLEAYVKAGRPLDHAGHDFWLTRNGHGAGFWDRGMGDLGERLSKASKAHGGADLYQGDDGKFYLM